MRQRVLEFWISRNNEWVTLWRNHPWNRHQWDTKHTGNAAENPRQPLRRPKHARTLGQSEAQNV